MKTRKRARNKFLLRLLGAAFVLPVLIGTLILSPAVPLVVMNSMVRLPTRAVYRYVFG